MRNGERLACRPMPPGRSPERVPTSSTVWWASISRSPVAWTEIEAAVTTKLVEHVAEEGQAGVDVGLTRAIEIERNVDLSLLGGRWLAAVRLVRTSVSFRIGRLRRRADRDPQTALKSGPAGAVAHEHGSVDKTLPHVVAGQVLGSDETVEPDGHVNRQVSETSHKPLTLVDRAGDPIVHGVEMVECDLAGDLGHGVEVIRRTTFSSSSMTHDGARR